MPERFTLAFKQRPAGVLRLVLGTAAFRTLCYAVMVALALWSEARPAPSLPDWVLERVPYVEAIDRWNYFIWLACYVPLSLALLWSDVPRFGRYMVSAGLLALVRGLCIVLTGLGPVHGADVHAGIAPEELLKAFWQLATPFGFFNQDGGARLYLTKDLFFSGHTATTFLLLLYLWPRPKLRRLALAGHGVVVASVFFSHLHYSIDVVGAWAITLSLFVLREGQVFTATPPPATGTNSPRSDAAASAQPTLPAPASRPSASSRTSG